MTSTSTARGDADHTPPSPPSTDQRGGRRGRIMGLDVARGLAVVGMFAAHVAPTSTEQVWDGRSSVLFATLAGISLGLMTGGAAPVARSGRARQLLSVVLRGVFLVALGVLLTLLGTPIAIILAHYGVMFVVAALFLYAPRWALAALAFVFAVGGPLVVELIRERGFEYFQAAGDTAAAELLVQPFTWLTEYYPVPAWLAYLTVGILLARCDVRSARTHRAMLGGGIASALFGYGGGRMLAGGPLAVEAHSSTTWELFGAGGVAVAIAGLLLLVTTSSSSDARTAGAAGAAVAARGVLAPLAAVGSMPLTIYTAQIIALAVYLSGFDDVYDFDAWRSWWLLVVFAAGSVVFAMLWQRYVSRQGPLEWAFARMTLRPRASVA